MARHGAGGKAEKHVVPELVSSSTESFIIVKHSGNTLRKHLP